MSASPSEMPSTLRSLSDNLADIVAQAGSAVVVVNARRLPASGVHWRSGIIVTANHTVKRDEEITVTLPDNRSVSATLIGRDPSTDLAVLKLEEVELPTAVVSDRTSLQVGHIVMAIGRHDGGLSASWGVVSAISETGRNCCGERMEQFWRLDLTLYPGCSGGALIAATGEVVGITTVGPRQLALAIPASTVNRTVETLLATGRIARGYLGLGMQPILLPAKLQQTLNLSGTGGAIVVNVEPDGPADRAGIIIGDVILALAGNRVNDTGDVQLLLGSESVGKTVPVQILRGGTLVEVAIAVGERPWR